MYYQTQKMSPYVKGLIIANVAIFVLQMLPGIGGYVTGLGGLNPLSAYLGFELWRLVTYMFLHSTDMLFHILFNMLALWWFGAELEDIWGGKKFLLFYFICGIGAGLFSLLYLFINPFVLIVGASGAVLGVLTAYAHYYPNRQVLLFFILPIKVRTLVIGYAAISVLMTFNGGGGTSHLTHLGGIVVAWIYLKLFPMLQTEIGKWLYAQKLKNRQANAARESRRKKDFEQRVDSILGKISKIGMESLTSAEVKILQSASRGGRDLSGGRTEKM